MAPVRWPRIVVEAVVVAVAAGLVFWAWWADLRWFERHVLVDYCACTPAGVWLPRIARGGAVILATVLGLVVRPRLGRWVARSSHRDLAGILIAVVAAVVVSDVVVSRIPTGDRTPLSRTDLPHAVADPRVGWRFTPSQRVSVSVHGRAIDYAIDADGDRARSPDDRIDPELPTIVIAGESVAFGESLPWDETFAAMIAADRQVQVIDVGVPAYASDQAYLRVVDALARLHHPVAVITTFIPKMIRRNARTTRPHLARQDDGSLGLEPADEPFALTRLWRDEPYHGDGAIGLTRAVLVATADAARARGAASLVVVTNFGPSCLDGDGAWIFRELLDASTPSVHVALSADDTVGHGDLHPSARGSRKLADAIEAALPPAN